MKYARMRLWRGPARALLPVLILTGLCGESTAAYTYHFDYTWDDINHPNAYGQPAGSCTFTYPSNKPFEQSLALIVDNHLPVGTVLHSWGYEEFLPRFGFECQSSGVANGSNTIRSNTGVRTYSPRFFITNSLINAGTNQLPLGLFGTSVDGIGLKIYVKISEDTYYRNNNFELSGGGYSAGIDIKDNNSTSLRNPSAGSEIILNGSRGYLIAELRAGTLVALNVPGSPYNVTHILSGRVYFSIRGELVKTGNVTYSGPLSIPGASALSLSPTEHGFTNPGVYLGGSGITIQLPSCRLRGATDYQVNMGYWVDRTSPAVSLGGGLPFTGDTTPVGINLECSGKVDNVEFSFQDTGSTPLVNHNISLYDSAGGQSIDGLELEITYGGNRLDVHQTGQTPTVYKTNVGTKGNIKTDPSDTGFTSPDTASFGVRYVQRGPVTRGGSNYTGPVTGKVNMFVTYY